MEAIKCKHCGEFLEIKTETNTENEEVKNKVAQTNSSEGGNKLLFTFLGAILGIPMSYYFQPEIVQAKVGGIGGYLKNFGDILDNSDLIGNVLLGVVVFALIGLLIGYLIDANKTKKSN